MKNLHFCKENGKKSNPKLSKVSLSFFTTILKHFFTVFVFSKKPLDTLNSFRFDFFSNSLKFLEILSRFPNLFQKFPKKEKLLLIFLHFFLLSRFRSLASIYPNTLSSIDRMNSDFIPNFEEFWSCAETSRNGELSRISTPLRSHTHCDKWADNRLNFAHSTRKTCSIEM